MGAVNEVEFQLEDPDSGRPVGRLRLSVLGKPGSKSAALPWLLDLRGEEMATLEPIRIVEGAEYRYLVEATGTVRLEPSDLFSPDDETGRTGRLRPREQTGRLPIRVEVDGQPSAEVAVEVRSRKLDYLDDYRHMLADIASVAAELVLRRFSSTEQRLRADLDSDAGSLYRRFRFVRWLLLGGGLRGAVSFVLARPYVAWREIDEVVPRGAPLRASSATARRIAGPGRKQPWPGREPLVLPAELHRTRHEDTTDATPNRFVRFALEEWRSLALDVRDALHREANDSSAPVERGLRETDEVVAFVDEVLRHPVLLEAGQLERFPMADQVLARRPGYREIFEAYLLSQVGAQLDWQGGEDVYGAGQRDVATLYEYWVFLRLAWLVSRLCGHELDPASLLSEGSSTIDLTLQRGRRSSVGGEVMRRGRRMKVELTFDRSYEPGAGTWVRPMRPDCSLEIRLLGPAGAWMKPVRLHFDAKYRVERAVDALGQETNQALAADLAKMHAYRDAIFGAVGAYVVYPGSDESILRKYGEILPGLGAFPLRPGPDPSAEGEDAIAGFLDEVLDHLAYQATQHERARHWSTVARKEDGTSGPPSVVSWWSRPPADIRALVVRDADPELEAWASTQGIWPLAATSEDGTLGFGMNELDVGELVACTSPGRVRSVRRVEGAPRLMTRDDLEARGCPLGDGKLFFCLPISEEILNLPAWLSGLDLDELFEDGGSERRVVRWLDVLRRVR